MLFVQIDLDGSRGRCEGLAEHLKRIQDRPGVVTFAIGCVRAGKQARQTIELAARLGGAL